VPPVQLGDHVRVDYNISDNLLISAEERAGEKQPVPYRGGTRGRFRGPLDAFAAA
jgi:hypothetical protein